MAKKMTNAELALKQDCTPRQISKSRKRGWIWHKEEEEAVFPTKSINSSMEGFEKKRYTAPPALNPGLIL